MIGCDRKLVRVNRIGDGNKKKYRVLPLYYCNCSSVYTTCKFAILRSLLSGRIF